MKGDIIRQKLNKYLNQPRDSIMLDIFSGTPSSREGGSWCEVPVADLERITEDADFDPGETGYRKYLDRWFAEGLITGMERETGKS